MLNDTRLISTWIENQSQWPGSKTSIKQISNPKPLNNITVEIPMLGENTAASGDAERKRLGDLNFIKAKSTLINSSEYQTNLIWLK